MNAKTETKPGVPIAVNRRATFDYELADKYEAGIALTGSEVKMLRIGKADLSDAWVDVQRGEAWLRGLNIPAMDHSPFSHEPKRSRKLLLHAREIENIQRSTQRDGMTVVATKLYFRGRNVKIEIALARGKKKADKRESLKEKTAEKGSATSDDARASRRRLMRITWEAAEPGRVVLYDRERIELRGERAKPPGSRPSATLPSGSLLRVKVHRCRREELGDGLVFTIDGRLIDATKSVEAEIIAGLAPKPE